MSDLVTLAGHVGMLGFLAEEASFGLAEISADLGAVAAGLAMGRIGGRFRSEANRMVKRLRNQSLNAAIRLGLLPYRQPYPVETTQWDEAYSTHRLDFYGGIRERARYGVLLGYLDARQANLKILDVGCGVGLMRGRIPEHLIGRFCGCDPSTVAIKEAQDHAWPNSEFHVEAMPSPALGQFDVIICNEMLYYVDDVDTLLARLASMLQPGGWLLSSVTRHPGDFVLHEKLDHHFDRIDAVVVKSKVAGLKWRLACHCKRGSLAN